MPIVGDHPESGVRFVLERPRGGGPPFHYQGSAFTPDARFALDAVVDDAGAVTVTARDGAPADVIEKARLMLRTLHRQAKTDGDGAPPRKIVRWRGEK
jgi:hypothetical protein